MKPRDKTDAKRQTEGQCAAGQLWVAYMCVIGAFEGNGGSRKKYLKK